MSALQSFYRAFLRPALIAGFAVLSACGQKNGGEVADLEWLDDNFGQRALTWVDAENSETLAALSADARLAAFEREAAAVLTAPDRLPEIQIRGDHVYNYWQDREHVFGIWRRASYTDFMAGAPVWETLIDFDAWSARDGKEWILKGVSFAPGDSTRCLLFVAHKGQDAAIMREYDIAARSFVEDGFSLPESKSNVWWRDEDTLILGAALTGSPKTESGAARTLALWRRGVPVDEAQVYFETDYADFTAFPAFTGLAGEGRRAIAQGVDFFTRRYWLQDGNGDPAPLPLPGKMAFMGLYDDSLILALKEDWAPGEGMAFDNGDLVLIARDGLLERGRIEAAQLLYRPAADEQVRELRVLDGKVHLTLLKALRGRVIVLDPDGAAFAPRTLDDFSDGFISFGPALPGGEAVLARYEGPLTSPGLVRFEADTGEKTTLMRQGAAFDASNLTMTLHSVASKDGTVIPYTVIARKDLPLDGAAPTLVYGYGGFEAAVTPRYEPAIGKLWMEKGGVYVHAHLRGGGEFGPAWHDAPMLERRPRVYEDMEAVLADLHARKVSSPQHTGIMGRSNGGLMVAAVMVRSPDLMNAVVVGGPLIDMLNYDKLGPGASWTAEYGDPDNPSQHAFISTYSPIQNLRAEADYPRPLVITSTYDDRVWPGHARRFVARMEELGHDAVYYEDDAGGHYWELKGGPGPGDWRKRAKARAVEYVYLSTTLGLD